MTNDENELIGKVALCSKGIPGVIEGVKNLPWGLAWVGKKIKDGSLWSSRNPTVIADSLDDYKQRLA